MTIDEVIEELRNIPTYGFSDDMKEAIHTAIFVLDVWEEAIEDDERPA